MSNELQKVFDYSFVPTVKKMRKDNRKIRIVMGPVGSGKSSGCMVELVSRAMEQKPNSIGERRSRWAIVRNCYDDQTEILTEKRGWQLFKNLLPDDAVATLNGDSLVYKTPEGVLSYQYSGEMFGFESEGVNFLVTPEHKMWVSKRRTHEKIWGDYEVSTAKEIYGNQTVRVRRDAKWEGRVPQYDIDFFEFLGFWFAEGSCGEYGCDGHNIPSKRLNITQKKHVLYAELLFAKNDLTYRKSEKKDTDGCYTYHLEQNKKLMDIWDTFIQAGKQPTRSIPQWIKDAPSVYQKAFLYGYMVGDGGNYKGTIRLSTCSKIMADDLQEMVLKSGGVANIRMSDYTGKELLINGRKGTVNYPSYRITILGEEKYRPILHVNPNMTNHLRGWYKQPYNGMVYCVEMPLIPIYVRRKGKAFWCIRTYRQLEDSTILTFLNWFPSPIAGKYTQDDHTYRMDRLLPDGTRLNAEFRFRSLDRPDDVSNLLSTEYTGAYFNELREISKYIFDNMDSRIPRFPPHGEEGATWYGIVADTNPPDTDHWLWKLAEEKIPSDPILQGKYKIFQQPSGLSPEAENIPNLVPGYYQDIMIGKDPEWIKVYVMGEYGYVGTGQPVYRNYSDSVHCAKEPIKPMAGVPLILGFDAGLMPAVVICQMIPQGQFRILHEFPGQDLGMRKLLKDYVKPFLFTNYQGFAIVASGDVPKRAETDEGTTYGEFRDILGVSPRKPRSNALAPRIGAIDLLLTSTCYNGQPKFQLSPNCRMLRKGFISEYRRERVQVVGMDRMKDIPEKNDYSHIMEAAQYAALYAEKGIAMTSEQYQQAQQPVRIAPPVGAYA